MSHNVLAPTADFLACYPFQCDAHMIAWRGWMWRQGIDVRANGRRYNLRGLPIDGGLL